MSLAALLGWKVLVEHYFLLSHFFRPGIVSPARQKNTTLMARIELLTLLAALWVCAFIDEQQAVYHKKAVASIGLGVIVAPCLPLIIFGCFIGTPRLKHGN